MLCMLVVILFLFMPLLARASQKASAPFSYSGYSSPRYSGYQTFSQYVPMRDGVRLAVDVYIPTEGPIEPLPVILVMTPYHRASMIFGQEVDFMTSYPYARQISSYGYVFVVADVRGTGASFGTRYTSFHPDEIVDADELVNWIVQQSWSDGNVGMMGVSYSAILSYLNASNKNPHLKCIVPQEGMLNLYEFVYPGGILGTGFLKGFSLLSTFLDLNIDLSVFGIGPSKPVDEDRDGRLLMEATREHEANVDFFQEATNIEYRDSYCTYQGRFLGFTIDELGPSANLRDIERSGAAIYHLAGWFDFWPRDALTYMATLSNPSRILIGPYWHGRMDESLVWEHLRFFDRYLKGMDNGVDREPRYYFYTLGRNTWRAADEWPLPEQRMTAYYFGEGNVLDTSAPSAPGAFDPYRVDYSTTTGPTSRRGSDVSDFNYPDRAQEDKKCLTYTSVPLDWELEVTGHPVVHLFVSSTAADGDFFVYLEDVDERGVVHYVTEGQLRASLRKLRPRPWLPDLPWPGCYGADRDPLTPGEIVELAFDLLPTSYLFDRGHSIRIAIAGADKGNYATPELNPPPIVKVYRDPQYASCVELPVIPFDPAEYTGFWYNPDEPGTGLALEVQEGVLYLNWFVYDERGLPVWYGSGAEMIDSSHYAGPLLAWSGWPLGQAYGGAKAEQAGSMEIVFDSPREARLMWSKGGLRGSQSLFRFMEDLSPGSRDFRGITGWWYDPAFEGMGFFLEAQGGNLFMTWYHYRGDGTPRWWTSGGEFAPGSDSFVGDFMVWVQGACPGRPYRPPTLIPGGQSKVNLHFLNDSRAELAWNGGSLHLQRFRFSGLAAEG
jgi:putative CocE/NonD family hydrolase